MSVSALAVLNELLESIGINYQFDEWIGEIVYPYFTGEYQESPSLNEDGMIEMSFILNGFSRKRKDNAEPLLELEQAKEKIRSHFRDGVVVTTDSGSAVAIFYENTLANIPTGDAELKRIQINLKIKEWSVN